MTTNENAFETVPGLAFDLARGPTPASADGARATVDAGLPVADVSELPSLGTFWMSTVSVDVDGRFAMRAAMRRLGWTGGRLTVTADAAAGMLTVSEGGPTRVTAKGLLRLPVAIRQGCNLSAGARLLLVVAPDQNILNCFTAYAVMRWWRGSHGSEPGGGGS